MQLQYTITLLTIALIMPLKGSYNSERYTKCQTGHHFATDKDVNARNEAGNTQLHDAVITDNYKKIDELLKTAGINCNIQNNYGMTAFYIAAIKNKTEIVELLLNQENINPYLSDRRGCTPYKITTSNQIRDMLDDFTKNHTLPKSNYRYLDDDDNHS